MAGLPPVYFFHSVVSGINALCIALILLGWLFGLKVMQFEMWQTDLVD